MRLLWAFIAAGLVAAGCGGDDDDAGSDGETTGATSEISEQGDPVAGGSITVGLEAETNSWLPGTGQFSNAGTSVAFAIYDPLMRRDADGKMQPYLAESIEPNADLTEWTLKLRPDITFHDDTPLNAQALKTVFDDYLKAEGAVTAANLEVRVAGGAGYAKSSPASRRFREAAFIPVQSPSESQLRWELDRARETAQD